MAPKRRRSAWSQSQIPLSVFLRVFDGSDGTAERILANLDFRSAASFLTCYRHLFTDSQLYNGETTTIARWIAPFRPGPRRLEFRQGPLTLDHYLGLLHFSLHSLRLRGPNHSFPHYDFPLNCYKRWPVVPAQAPTWHTSCTFFPPEAPGSLANALLVTDRYSSVKIFRQGPEAYHLLVEFVVKNSFCLSAAVSPLGTAALLHHAVNDEVSVLLVEEGGSRLRHCYSPLYYRGPPSCFRHSCFWDEDNFVMFDEQWNFVLYTLHREDNRLRNQLGIARRTFFSPELSVPTVLKIRADVELVFREWGPSTEGLAWKPPGVATHHPCFTALSSPGGKDGSCPFLVMTDRCGVDHEAGHRLQIVLLSPGVTGPVNHQTYYLSTPNFYITDYVLHPDGRRIYVVGLTRLSQNMFFAFEPHATLVRPEVNCQQRGGLSLGEGFGEYDSLGVYEVDLRHYSGLPEAPPMVRVEARFYAPTAPQKLASSELLVAPSKERKFARKFGLLNWRQYRASCNRRFLVVRQEDTHLLLFPHAATYDSPPFSVGFIHRTNLFSSTAEMGYMVSLPSLFFDMNPASLVVHKMCTSTCVHASVEDDNEYRKLAQVPAPRVIRGNCRYY